MKGYFQSPVCTFYRDLTLTTDHSIARYIARLHPALGLYGRNPLQASEVRINCCSSAQSVDYWYTPAEQELQVQTPLYLIRVVYLVRNTV